MKYRILGIFAGFLTIIAQFLPGDQRCFVLRKVKATLYLIFG